MFASSSDSEGGGLENVLGAQPSVELADQVSQTCGEMIAILKDETLEQIVLLKLEGYTNEEIAERLGCVTRTVERKLERIRDKWTRDDS